MAYLSQYQYYANAGNSPSNANWGSYQYVPLKEIVNNFMNMYVGNDQLINNISRHKVVFHAKRAIQELNYDAFKEVKALELDVCSSLRFILPSDYVNWIRISVYRDGVLMPLSENRQIISADAFLQDENCSILFDQDGEILRPSDSDIDLERIAGTKKSLYMNENSQFSGMMGYEHGGRWYFDYNFSGRFGLETSRANVNPTFRIDKKAGVVNFDSSMSGQKCIMEYVTDGMESGDESLISVNKLFEKHIYLAIEYAILDSKLGVQEYIVARKRKAASASLNNAKIRISNIKPDRLLMDLRGRDKWIK